MTKFYKVTVVVAIDDEIDTLDNPQEFITASINEMFDYSDMTLLDTCVHEQTLVDTAWLDSVLPNISDDDDDDDYEVFTPQPQVIVTAPPTSGTPAGTPQQPPPLDLSGIDPESPQADDIAEAYIEAITPDPDDPT